jgi:hypothetical protein
MCLPCALLEDAQQTTFIAVRPWPLAHDKETLPHQMTLAHGKANFCADLDKAEVGRIPLPLAKSHPSAQLPPPSTSKSKP